MRVAYVTAESCGSGHAVRGIALVQAAERLASIPRDDVVVDRVLRSAAMGTGMPAVQVARVLALPAEHGVHSDSIPVADRSAGDDVDDGAAHDRFALAHARSLTLRAFGPPVRAHGPLPDLTGYEASTDWRQRVLQWQPDFLLGDLRPAALDTLRVQLGVPAWLLLRIWTREWRGAPGWDRVISIEPGSSDMAGVTDTVPPIVGPWRFTPPDGAELPASYNVFWEAHLYGFPVRWVPGGSPDCALRLRLGTDGVTGNGADVLVRQVNEGA